MIWKFTGLHLFQSGTLLQCQMTSVITGSVQVTHYAIGAGTLHSFRNDWKLLIQQSDWWKDKIMSINLYIVVV